MRFFYSTKMLEKYIFRTLTGAFIQIKYLFLLEFAFNNLPAAEYEDTKGFKIQ